MILRLFVLLIVGISFCVCKSVDLDTAQSDKDGNQHISLSSPVLQLMAEIMNQKPDSTSGKAADLKKRVDSYISNIQKIPRRNETNKEMEKAKKELADKKREFEEQEWELQENMVINPIKKKQNQNKEWEAYNNN